jgi:translocation and assembly module TamB
MAIAATAGGGPRQFGTADHPAWSAAKWAAIVLAGLLLLVAAVLVGLNSDPGRRWVASQVDGIELSSGLRIGVKELDGSLYGELRIRGLTLSDPNGEFFAAPLVELDWRPFSYIRNHIDIRSALIPEARLRRLPELKPSADPDAPMLPDIDIDVDRFELRRLLIEPPVTGRRHLLSAEGGIHIADRRAQLRADVRTLAGAGIAGGDRLVLRLDAVPDENRLAIEANVRAPAEGLVAGLLSLDRPLTASIGGRGSWQRWDGRLTAALAGDGIANLAISARDGTFRITGPTRPGLLFEGVAQRLLAPLVQLDLVTTLDERRADVRLRLNSRALALAAEGLVDLGESRFGDFRAALRVAEPGVIAPRLRASDLRLAILLNGPFGAPRIAYDLQAVSLGFDETVVHDLRARGAAQIDPDRMLVPVSAQASRITGLNAAFGGLVSNVRIDGTFAISNGHVLSDDLRIRSDRLNATAVVTADIAAGEYRGAINGRVNNYLVEGIGLLDVTTDLDLVSSPQGFGLTGRVAIRTRRIDNSTARDLLAGNAIITADLAMTPAGVFTIDDIRVASPGLTVTSGSGRYEPGGRIALRLSGSSRDYGPVTVMISGTAQAPDVRIRASRPGLGIGLADVEADIRSVAGGFAVTASGQSQYGPFSADLTIVTSAGPLTLDIRRLTIAGLDFAGRIVRTAAGPFAGTLTLSGSGIEGVVRLAAAGRYQRADVSARANGARIPGDVPILIQRAIVEASAILYPDAPSISADVQLAGLRSGELLIEKARGRIDYRGGNGRAQLTAEGRRGVPFQVAANAALQPGLYRVAAQGSLNRISFRLREPALVRRVAGGWQVTPSTIAFPQGEVRFAARIGDTLVVQTRFERLDLSIANAFAPDLGIGGRATGSIDLVQAFGGMPRAEARLTLDDFTRTGAVARSAPVDVAAVARLRPEGGSASAIIRRGGAVIGRAQARLQPLAAGGAWTDRLLASPLGGGIRYNGPAEVLWSLSGMADQQLTGPIAVAADFSGRLERPQLVGVVRANRLAYEHETYGTRITDLAVQGRFTSSRLELTSFNGRAGGGTVKGQGSVDLAAAGGFPIDLRLTLDRARLARSEALGAVATGSLAIVRTADGRGRISGELRLPEARYQVVRQGAAEIAQLEGVRRKGEPLPDPEAERVARAEASPWALDVRVLADNELYISGMGLESEWRTSLRVTGTTANPLVTGRAEVLRGTYSFAGRRFELDEGIITFTGSRPIDPRINIRASTQVEGTTATLLVNGTADTPRIELTSSPALPQDEILARLFFGESVTNISAMQAVQLAASLNALRGSGGGLNPLGKLRSAAGVDRLRILAADEALGRGTAIAAGLHISNDIYVELVTDARGFTATQLEIALSKSLSLLSHVGSAGTSNFSIRYSKDY